MGLCPPKRSKKNGERSAKGSREGTGSRDSPFSEVGNGVAVDPGAAKAAKPSPTASLSRLLWVGAGVLVAVDAGYFLLVAAWRVWQWRAAIAAAAVAVVRRLVIPVARRVVVPAAVAVGGAYANREWLVRRAVAWAAARGVVVAPPTIDVSVDARARSASATVAGVGVALAGDGDAAATDVVELGAVRAAYDRREGVGVVLDGLRVTFVAYDARFRDTNVARLLERLGAGGDDDAAAAAAAPPPPEPAPAAAAAKFHARVINGVIEVKASGPLGTRPVIPAIKLDDEAISSEVLASRVKFAAWINAVVLRTLANSSLDAVAGVFGAVGGGVLAGTDVAFDGINRLAGHVPVAGRLVHGATGATSSILKGTVGGATAVVGGVAGGGKSIFKGLTSGSASGVAAGFKDAGKSVGGGVVGGVAAVGGGVVGGAKAAGTAVVDGTPPPKKKGGLFGRRSKSPPK